MLRNGLLCSVVVALTIVALLANFYWTRIAAEKCNTCTITAEKSDASAQGKVRIARPFAIHDFIRSADDSDEDTEIAWLRDRAQGDLNALVILLTPKYSAWLTEEEKQQWAEVLTRTAEKDIASQANILFGIALIKGYGFPQDVPRGLSHLKAAFEKAPTTWFDEYIFRLDELDQIGEALDAAIDTLSSVDFRNLDRSRQLDIQTKINSALSSICSRCGDGDRPKLEQLIQLGLPRALLGFSSPESNLSKSDKPVFEESLHGALQLMRLGYAAPDMSLDASVMTTPMYVVRDQIDALLAAGLLNATLDQYEKLEELYDEIGNVLGALTTKIEEIAVRRALYFRDYGSDDNYFSLVGMSCQWSALSRWSYDRGLKQAALTFAVNSVNLLQDARRAISKLPNGLRECFLRVHEDRYRFLVDLFVDVGQFSEAEQVLGMLKDFELYEYVHRGERWVDRAFAHIPLAPADRAVIEHADDLAQEFVSVAQDYEVLRREQSRGASPNPTSPTKFIEARRNADRLHQLIRSDLQAVVREVRAAAVSPETKTAVTEALANTLPAQLNTLAQHTRERVGVLYTVILPDRLDLILATSYGSSARRIPISSIDLEKRVLEFRRTVLAGGDAKRVGQDLYDLLIAPFAGVLTKANIDVLLVSPDLSLRYLPFAALHDGDHYLIERFVIGVFTAASRVRLAEAKSRTSWRIAAFGVTEASENLEPLGLVRQELAGIVQDPRSGGRGMFPGKIALNGDFTRERFVNDLAAGKFSIFHIASHFVFEAGPGGHSYLSLGNGERISWDELSSGPFSLRMNDMDLLTLSACETAVGGENADGSEIESFAALAQDEGVRSVLASLWKVSDAATALFMRRFYEIAKGTPAADKAAVLRRVQREFLSGTVPHDSAAWRDISQSAAAALHPIPEDQLRSMIKLPYSWAAFVLSGDWR